MSAIDFAAQHLFVDSALDAGVPIALDRGQSNYVLNVLRLKAGDGLLVFNGRDGEWFARIEPAGRREAALRCERMTRKQAAPADLVYAFAPLKHARLDYMVQKAVEMGAGSLQPVLTQRTQVSRLNRDRMRANIVEAAEQCGILALPELREERKMARWLDDLPATRRVVFCDEDAESGDAAATLQQAGSAPLALLIGPEGGFAPEERAMLLKRAGTIRLSLGPRILRADTAAVAALAVVQAIVGDWRKALC